MNQPGDLLGLQREKADDIEETAGSGQYVPVAAGSVCSWESVWDWASKVLSGWGGGTGHKDG